MMFASRFRPYARFALLVALSLTSLTTAETRTVYVDVSHSAGGNGMSWASAYNDVQDAFNSLASIPATDLPGLDIRVHIAQGTCRPAQTRPFAFSVSVDLSAANSLTIAGGFAGARSATPDARDSFATPTILSADVLGDDAPAFAHREDNCFVVLAPFAFGTETTHRPPPIINILGLTLEGGHTPRTGGQQGAGFRGLIPSLDFNDTPLTYTFEECVIRDNYIENNGGGVGFQFPYNVDLAAVTFRMSKCFITGNRSDWVGGGLFLDAISEAHIETSTIANNVAYRSCGGATLGNSTRVAGCTLAGNHVLAPNGTAGAVGYWGDDFMMESCLVASNYAALGGGMVAESGYITNCTIVDNSAVYGGGVFSSSNSAYFEFCIVARNASSTAGPQMAGGGWMPFVSHCAIENNADGLYFPFQLFPPSAFPEFLPFNTDFRDADGPDNDASTWADNNYRLVPHSSLIDAANVWPGLMLDLDGYERRVEGVLGRGREMDIGCYESQLALCPADMTADGGVTIDDLLFFIDHFERGSSLADIASGPWRTITDDAVTINDLLFFLEHFEQGC